MSLQRIANWVKIGLMAFASIFFLLLLFKGDQVIMSDVGVQNQLVGPFLGVTYVFLVIAVLIALAFALFQIIDKPQDAKASLLGIGAIAVILVVSYFLASGVDYVNYPASMNITEQTSRLSGMGMNAMYISLAAAVGVTFFAEIQRIFK